MKSKWIFYASVVLVFVLTLFLFYRAYSALGTMARFNQAQVDVSTLEHVAALTAKAGEEEFESARYFGVKGVNYVDQLTASRKEVDSAVASLRHLLESKHTQLLDAPALHRFVARLQSIRSHVDTLNISCEKKFNHPVENEPILTLLHALKLKNTAFEGAKIDQEISAAMQMLYAAKSLEDERALLAFFLARRIPLTEKNFLAWEAVLEGKANAAAQKELSRPVPLDTLKKLQNNLTVQQRLSAIRGDVFEHADSGEFSTQLYDLGNAFLMPLEEIYRSEMVHIRSINRTLRQGEKDQKRLGILFVILGIMFSGVLFFLYRFLHATQREKQALEESLLEIASDLNSERRRELEAIMDQGDRVAVYRFLARTTMEARTAEERALQAEKAKDLFLANMSHEIRTPLNGILGFTQLMQSTPLNAEQEEFMGVIEGSSDNLLKIVNDILDLSKIHADKIELESIPFSIRQHAEKAIEPHAARALERGIEYSTFIDPTLPKIKSDPTKLTQVMTNLIGNAVKFTGDGGTVDVDVRMIKESDEFVTVRFSIKDSGVGISPEQQQKIFEPFSQADVSTTREFGGTGLGLTITRDIIGFMGGKLDLVSEEGRGSEFFFELTFERAGEDEAIRDRLEGVQLAYYHAGQSTLRQMERNLALYARASGGRFRMIGDHELDLLDDVDLLLLDYSNHETRENIEKLLWLGKRTILISTAAQKHETDDLANRVERIIYRPLTASKLIRACAEQDARQDQRSPHDSSALEIPLEGMNILVAEDNPINQKLIGRVLEGMGITPVLVSNGKEAVEMRMAQHFDAILMDIQMPVMGGVESTQNILKYEYSHGEEHVPIIALTANALQGDRERYLREGFDDYISKPVNIDQLRQALRTHCFKPEKQSAVQQNEPVLNDDGFLDIGLYNFHTILMYSKSNVLVQRLHHDALSYAGHTFSTVNSEAGLLKHLEVNPPEFVLLDTYSIDLEDCTLLDAIRNQGVGLFVYGTLDPILGCRVSEKEHYTSVAALLKALQ